MLAGNTIASVRISNSILRLCISWNRRGGRNMCDAFESTKNCDNKRLCALGWGQ